MEKPEKALKSYKCSKEKQNIVKQEKSRSMLKNTENNKTEKNEIKLQKAQKSINEQKKAINGQNVELGNTKMGKQQKEQK